MKDVRDIVMFWRQSFQLRIFWAFFLLVVLFVPTTGYIGYLQALGVAEKQMELYTIETGRQIADHVDSFLQKHRNNVNLLAALFENKLIDPNREDQVLESLRLFKKDHPEFVNIFLAKNSGTFLMVPPQRPEVHKVFNPRTRPWYRGAVASGTTYWTGVYRFASNQKPGITVSTPFYDTSNNLQGVCGIDVDLIAFSRFLRDIDIGKESIAYIYENSTGRLIGSPWQSSQPTDQQKIDLLHKIKQQFTARQVEVGLTEFNGLQFFTAYTPYKANQWTIGVTVSTSSYLQKIQLIKKTTITLVIIAVLLAGILSFLLSRNITTPLLQLKQGIERVTSGDLEYRVQVSNPDIARELAGAFNKMAVSLRQSLIELKSTYVELREKQKLAAVGKMTAGIAHEIKNPLGIILGSTQVVLDQKRPWEMREKAASFIMDEVVRLDSTLKSFLAFAKPATPVFSEVNVVELLEDILSATEEKYSNEGYQIIRNIQSEVPPIEADPGQIRQIFLNIFLNACKAMEDGGTIIISIRSEKDPQIDGSSKRFISIQNPFTVARDWLIVSIADEGHGIQHEQLENIMDPFVSFRDDGIGLGLSIVSQLVKLHRGHIEVDTIPEKGTTFHLYFPCIIKESIGNVQPTVS